jgi:preprotein translocase subunit SecB
MTEPQQEATTQANSASTPNAVFQMQRVYIKDASVELPNAPQVFLEKTAPAIEVAVNVDAMRLSENIFESDVTVTVTAKHGEQVAFLVECKQSGIFEISGVEPEQLDPLLGILCPGMLYPYLRANVADLITRTGFPPVHLSDINFEQFYQQRLVALKEQQNQASSSTATA